ncbi:MAG: LPS export ABC transporter periplasmic protein LptC [Rhodoferax sp.]|uniref:LPS export ABC transporter periplasmic protein LptC n=1 Tax=Rhodoferax sp. TaxID=50421 RepID=UPI00260B580A|nr:LPS export ABC transporter periplasmic protein LptC [Rhodoferax sp.]MDD5333617.1 LPS export ABC transporter periplasmic protein LptC [Rhodoferax sp.]
MIELLRTGWKQLSLYLPVVLMGVLALGTYWLVRSTPQLLAPEPAPPARHEPDYFMRKFSVKTFDDAGRLKSEVMGSDARHFPDTDTLEIDFVRIRSFDQGNRLTTATAKRAVTNGDASEVQLFGDARVVREPGLNNSGQAQQRSEFRGEFLHAFLNTERIKSHQPVELIRGNDRFTADAMDFDNLDRVLLLKGHVKGTLQPDVAK